jgi:two-component system, NtrC family, sensor kinase
MDEFNELLAKFEDHKNEEIDDQEQKPSILLIDDDDSIRRGLSRALSNKYKVLIAESGLKGVTLLSKEIHCVILDVKMRKLDGFSTYPKLKQKCPNVLIIFYTAFQTEHDLRDVINKYKPEGYIEKGRDITFLENLLENAVRKHQLILENEAYKKDLEKKVAERTVQYREERDKAQKLLTDLKQTQALLVEAEKRGAVYHLVAGVRHELNTHVQTLFANLQSLKYTDIEFVKRILIETYEIIDAIEKSDYKKSKFHCSNVFEISKEIDDEIEQGDISKNITESLESAMNASRVIQNIVNQLKDVSEHEDYEMREEKIDDIIEMTLKYLGPRIKERISNLTIVKEFLASPGILVCNKYKIIQALTAQIMNSLDALEIKEFVTGETPTLYFRVEKNANMLQITTGDNGVGISPENVSHVFTPFFSSKGLGQKGTGLGLSQVAAIVAKHDGHYRVKSKQGKCTEIVWSFST